MLQEARPIARGKHAPSIESGLCGGGCHLRVLRRAIGYVSDGTGGCRVDDLVTQSVGLVQPGSTTDATHPAALIPNTPPHDGEDADDPEETRR